MTPWIVLAVAIAGAGGAVARYALDSFVTKRSKNSPIPLGTMVINVSGSFFLGLVTSVALTHGTSTEVRAIAGSGFLAAYTTFSTASTQTADLVRDGRYLAAAANCCLMLIASTGAAALGLWLGTNGA